MTTKTEVTRPHPTNLKTLGNGTYPDAEQTGLYFIVKGDSRTFAYRFKIGSERPWLTIGNIDTLTLKQARDEVKRLHADLRFNGIDPRTARNTLRDGVTFKEWCDDIANIGPDKEHVGELISHYSIKEQFAWRRAVALVPSLHKMKLQAITVDHVEPALKPIWTATPMTGRKTMQVLAAIFRILKARKLYQGDNPADFREALKERRVLKPITKIHKTKHHPSLPFKDVPALMLDLFYDPSASARVLEAVILCAGRQNEVRRMEVRELKLDEAMWVIPAAKMKADRDHVVALAPRMVELLRAQLKQLPVGSQYVFPTDANDSSELFYSEAGLQKALRKRGLMVEHYGKQARATLHGMRTSFKTWSIKTPVLSQMQREATEFALSHKVYDDTEASYAAGDTMHEERLPLMTAWADHCLSLVPAGAPKAKPSEFLSKVVKLRAA